jgi:hypothetical protein
MAEEVLFWFVLIVGFRFMKKIWLTGRYIG